MRCSLLVTSPRLSDGLGKRDFESYLRDAINGWRGGYGINDSRKDIHVGVTVKQFPGATSETES